MRTYRFYAHPQGLAQGFDFVKVGFSWKGAIFDIIWLMLNRAWMASLLYLVGATVLWFLMAFAVVSQELPNEEQVLDAASWGVFVVCRVALGWFGNAALERRLVRKGYTLVSTVQAPNADAEVLRLREQAQAMSATAAA